MRRILVIRGGALGDFILTLPVLAALRGRYPDASVEILGCPKAASLAAAAGLADRVSPIESPSLAGFFAPAAPARGPAADYFARFDLIVSYLYDPDHVFQSNVSRCGSAKFIAGPYRPDESLNTHATGLLLQPLETLGIRNADPRPRLALPAADLPGTFRLAAHPGSGSEKKNWPESNWSELLSILAAQTEWNFLLIGGEAEGSRCRRLAAALPGERVVVAQDLPLVELAQKMKSCGAFIGHDSGITHLAAALDLPGLALWGPSSELTWRPKSEKISLIRDAGGLAGVPATTVYEALKKLSR